jgi:AraC-like DNA-binding protein
MNTRPSAHPVLESLKQAVRSYADAHANADGLAITAVPGLRMMCRYQPSGPMRSMYRPLVCLILQGAKQLTAARSDQVFVAGQAVIVGVDLPVVGTVIQASRAEPYLAIAIELDMSIMHAMTSQVPDVTSPPQATTVLSAEKVDEDVLMCASRLMRLIDHPDAVPIVRPAVLQELHYWLLSSAHGPSLRSLCAPQGNAQRIGRAIDILRKNFHQPLTVDALACAASMSASAFHRHFRAVTSISPLQFQKQLRLIEARRLMLSEGLTARRAAFQVGYESSSQFTREYVRMFGAPPRRDTAKPSSASQNEQAANVNVMV